MFGVIVSILQLAAVINALVRSLQARFIVGIASGCVRALLLVAGAFGALWARSVGASVTEARVPVLATSMALAATVLGPMVSFATLWLAHRRKKDAPAAEEERLGRPFTAWLPVALFDATFVAINVFASVIANPF
jgi:hypothetical protein